MRSTVLLCIGVLLVCQAPPASAQSSACAVSTELGDGTGSAGVGGTAGGGRGSIRQYTGAPTTISSFSQEFTLNGTGEMTFQIWEGPSVSGPWLLVAQTIVPGQGPGRAEYDSGPMNAPLQTGRYYAIIAYSALASIQYHYRSAGGTVYPSWTHFTRIYENAYPPGTFISAGAFDCHQWLCEGNNPTCRVAVTAPPVPRGGDVTIEVDASSPSAAVVDLALDWSDDGGATWNVCTMAASSPNPNPALGVATGISTFVWDSLADGAGLLVPTPVDLRSSVSDGTGMSSCVVSETIDNVVPAPSCVITSPLPATIVRDAIGVTFDTGSAAGGQVDVLLEWSTDGGATWFAAAMTAGSPLPNPALGVATGSATMEWDSRGDGVGVLVVAPTDLRVSVTDASPLSPSFCGVAVDVDNTLLCFGICGDCNLNGMGPEILDALTGAQISAGLAVPSATQMACCDVDSSMTVAIIDALLMAQGAAGLPVALVCR